MAVDDTILHQTDVEEVIDARITVADVAENLAEVTLQGFYGTTPIAKPAVTGTNVGELASATSLRAALVALGLITDSTTA